MLHQSPQTTVSLPRPTAEPDVVRNAYRGLVAMGWSVAEAGNLAAHLAGLDITRKQWRIAEIEGLMFIRSLVHDGRLDP
jgi:hypothetical protein